MTKKSNKSSFSHYPNKPKVEECSDAFVILCSAHAASSSFLDIFDKTRKARVAQGAPTDKEQDLLRAMLAFSTAGLDSMIKQLIRDALPAVIDKNTGAHEQFKAFVKKSLKKDEQLNDSLLADIFSSKTPRTVLIERLVYDLTSNSLQSAEAIFTAGAYFNIPSASICSDIKKMKDIFLVRNQIVHEMDIKFGQVNRSRYSRKRATMIADTNFIFSVAEKFLAEAAKHL